MLRRNILEHLFSWTIYTHRMIYQIYLRVGRHAIARPPSCLARAGILSVDGCPNNQTKTERQTTTQPSP